MEEDQENNSKRDMIPKFMLRDIFFNEGITYGKKRRKLRARISAEGGSAYGGIPESAQPRRHAGASV